MIISIHGKNKTEVVLMKKLILLALFIPGYFTVYSQDCLDKVANQAIEIRDLKTKIEQWQKDSAVVQEKIGKLQNEIATLQEKVKDLDTKKVKIERDTLQKQLGRQIIEVTNLTQKKSEAETKLTECRNEIIRKGQEQFVAGQQEVYNQIAQSYQLKPFDDLVKSSTKLSVDRDITLIGNNAAAKQKLQDLQKYFAAQQVLEEKYGEENVKNAQARLNTITQSDAAVKILNGKLEKYKSCTDALKTTIDKILLLDKQTKANNEEIQKRKLQDILLEFSWYFRNYRFNFNDYPYLSDIILEIMKLKQKDANSDISHLTSKL
jgi:hypothetical protein